MEDGGTLDEGFRLFSGSRLRGQVHIVPGHTLLFVPSLAVANSLWSGNPVPPGERDCRPSLYLNKSPGSRRDSPVTLSRHDPCRCVFTAALHCAGV